MSVDGVVMCGCLEAGVAAPAPCPVVRGEAWIYAAPGYEALQSQVRSWAKTACDHPRFWLIDHQVRKMALLGEMAAHGGELAFPAIYAALPVLNGGRVDPVDSARCLAEMDRLAALMAEGTMVAIVDADDETVVFVDPNYGLVAAPRHRANGPAIFHFDERGAVHGLAAAAGMPMTSTWLGEDAVVRVLDADGVILFESDEFVQEWDGEFWVCRDVQTGAVVRHCSPVSRSGDVDWENEPHRMRAETRPIAIDDYLAGVAELRALFETSVRVGRPLHWV